MRCIQNTYNEVLARLLPGSHNSFLPALSLLVGLFFWLQTGFASPEETKRVTSKGPISQCGQQVHRTLQDCDGLVV